MGEVYLQDIVRKSLAQSAAFVLTMSSFDGPQVRLMLNKATFPLSICERSRKDRKYGTCSLDEFVRANEYSLNVEYQSEIWDATCELDI